MITAATCYVRYASIYHSLLRLSIEVEKKTCLFAEKVAICLQCVMMIGSVHMYHCVHVVVSSLHYYVLH